MLESGDYIEAINGEPLWDKEALVTYLNHNGANEAVLTVRRGGEVRQVRMSPVRTLDGSYKLGAWVRDDTQGIGTLTYLDANGNFGALGHGISDSDTGDVVEIDVSRHTQQLTRIQMSAEAWVQEDIVNYSVEKSIRAFTIGRTKYSYPSSLL